MKTFRQKIAEETMPQSLSDKEFVGVESEAVRDNINGLIKGVTSKAFITPYIGLERVRKVLAYFHISIPSYNFMQGDYGYNIFNINQFGTKYGQTNDGQIIVKEDSPYSIYFEWQMNEDGLFDIFSEIVTDDELEEILADYDSESEDNEENEEEYAANAQQDYEHNKEEHDGNLKEELLSEIKKVAKRAEEKAAKEYYDAYDAETKAREDFQKKKTPEAREAAEAAKNKRLKAKDRLIKFQKYNDKA